MVTPTTNVSSIKTKPKSLNVQKRLYSIYEGEKTERQYFEALASKKCLDLHIMPITISKYGLDKHTTKREDLVTIAIDEITFQKTGMNSVRRFISHALSNIKFDEFEKILSKINNRFDNSNELIRKENMSGYPTIRKYIESELNLNGCINNKHITNIKQAISVTNSAMQKIDDTYRIESVDSIIGRTHPTQNEEYDYLVWVIFDRDEGSIYPSDFKKAIEKCNKFGYEPIVSSPKFELWLSMHHPNFDYKSPKASYTHKYGNYLDDELKILEKNIDSKVTCNKDGIKKTVRKNISMERFELYYEKHYLDAIKVSKKSIFQIDPMQMIDKPGTNIGHHLEKILKKD